MVEIERDAILNDLDEQTVLDVDTLDERLANEDLRVLLSAVDHTDPGAEDAPEGEDAPGVDATAAASAGGRSELLGADATRQIVEGNATAGNIDNETLRASIQRVYSDTVDDYSIGIEGEVASDTSPSNPQEALARVSSDALGGGTGEEADDHAAGVSADATGSDLSARASTDDGSADPSDYSAGTEGDA